MVDKDVLFEKVNSIQNCLKRIHDTVKKDDSDFEDLDVQDIVVLNIQRAVQLTIDIAFHVAAAENFGLAQTLRDAFRILKDNKVIESSLANKMEKMVGFRNIAVHDYQTVDSVILRKIVSSHLGEIEELYSSVFKHFNIVPK